jgi:ATP-dependent protease ClpP protease subunit
MCALLFAGMGAFLCSAGTKGRRYALPNSRFLMQKTGFDEQVYGQASDIILEVRHHRHHRHHRMARKAGVSLASALFP